MNLHLIAPDIIIIKLSVKPLGYGRLIIHKFAGV
jgi:hypothetical protein